MDELTAQQRGSMTLDALTVVESIDAGEWTPRDAVDVTVDAAELVQGLVLYANLLETMLYLTRGSGISEVRRAARETAQTARAAS